MEMQAIFIKGNLSFTNEYIVGRQRAEMSPVPLKGRGLTGLRPPNGKA